MSWFLDLSLLITAILWASSNHQVKFLLDIWYCQWHLFPDFNCSGDVNDCVLDLVQLGDGPHIAEYSQRLCLANCVASTLFCVLYNTPTRSWSSFIYRGLQGWSKWKLHLDGLLCRPRTGSSVTTSAASWRLGCATMRTTAWTGAMRITSCARWEHGSTRFSSRYLRHTEQGICL